MLYGSGLRRIEAVRLRVNDIDFDQIQVRIWNGKGFKHRLTTLAPELVHSLRHQIQKVTLQLKEDLQNRLYSGVWIPDALARKYSGASHLVVWHYLFSGRAVRIQTHYLRIVSLHALIYGKVLNASKATLALNDGR